jgi:hypothetical protein
MLKIYFTIIALFALHERFWMEVMVMLQGTNTTSTRHVLAFWLEIHFQFQVFVAFYLILFPPSEMLCTFHVLHKPIKLRDSKLCLCLLRCGLVLTYFSFDAHGRHWVHNAITCGCSLVLHILVMTNETWLDPYVVTHKSYDSFTWFFSYWCLMAWSKSNCEVMITRRILLG